MLNALHFLGHISCSYGGAGSQAVDYRFSVGFETFMASTHNVVYAFLDGRGTTSRGQDFKHLLYRSMATVEVEDQILGCQCVIDFFTDYARTHVHLIYTFVDRRQVVQRKPGLC